VGRIAGNSDGYQFRMTRATDDGVVLTEHGFDLVSVTTFIKQVLAVPPSAMAWTGFKLGLEGLSSALAEDPEGLIEATTPQELQDYFKERGVSPNLALSSAGARGTSAHQILEEMAAGNRKHAEVLAGLETGSFGTHYGLAAVSWWDEKVQPEIDKGAIVQVLSEVPVWYAGEGLNLGWCGTLDLAIEWQEGWEILDAKTHKPAKGFTLPGKGPGYDSDAAQIRAYRMAWEEMGLGLTLGQRTIVLRENGKYLEDDREVSPDFVRYLRRLYRDRNEFDQKGVVA
jgi:hypothetical protein